MSLKKCIRATAAAASLAGTTLAHAALLGLPVNDPTIDVAAGGVVTYNATSGLVTISGTPQVFQQLNPFLFGEFVGTGPDDERLFTIQFRVDGTGQFVAGVDGPDLIVKGALDVDFDGIVDYSGVLLEAEVTAFGFLNGAAGVADRFDLRLNAVGGVLAGLFAGKDLSVVLDSEPSDDYPSPFNGNFGAGFIGPAKVLLGTVDAPVVAACKVDIESFCSVGGSANKSVCRINITKSPKHWEHVTHYHRGLMFRVYKYGMHGDPVPAWASRYPATDVKFSYVVKNTGTTPISNLQVIDSFDIGIPGVPTSLAPGQTVTLTRTEALRDGMVNSTLVTGESGTAICSDKDSVAIKDKVRSKRAHDNDKYKEKDNDNDRR
jgi:hypothetical protein